MMRRIEFRIAAGVLLLLAAYFLGTLGGGRSSDPGSMATEPGSVTAPTSARFSSTIGVMRLARRGDMLRRKYWVAASSGPS